MFEIGELIRATGGRLVGSLGKKTVAGISIDSRGIKPDEAFVAIKGNNFDGHDFIGLAIEKGAKAVIGNSSCREVANKYAKKKVSFIVVEDTLKALGDIARFKRRKFDIPVIAVTGSNGKTTTKEMIACVLSKKFKVLKNEGTKNNPIGLPMALMNVDSSCDIAVLEIGTNHFGEVRYLAGVCLPNVGIITNIGPSHLEYFGDLGGVLREKSMLLDALKEPKIAILNRDDDLLKKWIARKKKNVSVFGIGIENNSDFTASCIEIVNGKAEFLVNKKFRFTLKTHGCYNIYNALIAIGVGRIFGLDYEDIASAFSSFDYPQSRFSVAGLKNTRIIDDTYNSNPLSLRHALEVLANFRISGKKIFVMGDMLELGPNAETFHRLAGKKAAEICDTFITVGSLSKFAAIAAREAGFDIKDIFICESVLEAKEILFNKVLPGKDDVVLVKGSHSMKMGDIFNL